MVSKTLRIARMIAYVEKLGLAKMASLLLVFCAATAIVSSAQTFNALIDLNGTDGANPTAALVLGTDGNYYGTTAFGGDYNNGTVFKITPAGTLTTLYSFCPQTNCPDGSEPDGLVQGKDGNFYGTTFTGGAYLCSNVGCGTVFKITPSGTLTTLYSFAPDGCVRFVCSFTGNSPFAGLVQGNDGNFYGTTFLGTGIPGGQGDGTVFKITPTGTLTTLYSFCSASGCTDGAYPTSGLVQGTDGNFYGTTEFGGGPGNGTVFKITPAGTLTTLYGFCSQTNCTDGSTPIAGLVEGTDSNYYGTTDGGGNYNVGTVFKITKAGALTTLYSFEGSNDGAYPWAALVQGTDGNFYGAALEGGAYFCSQNDTSCGTLFKITPSGTLTTLYSFEGSNDGFGPQGALMQATNGNFYGTDLYGGNLTCGGGVGCGTVFSLSLGFGPFVETRPTSGKVGARVIILGNNLKGTTSVSFNGTSAAFKVVSNTEIRTTVPTGATTGEVKVKTPTGTLTSNVVFRVKK